MSSSEKSKNLSSKSAISPTITKFFSKFRQIIAISFFLNVTTRTSFRNQIKSRETSVIWSVSIRKHQCYQSNLEFLLLGSETKKNPINQPTRFILKAAIQAMLRLALLQVKVAKDKVTNIQNALAKITQTVNESKPRIVALSECFNCPYGTNFFREYSETIPDGETCRALSASAKQHGIYIVGGTFPEKGEDDAIYNTCTIWDPMGNLIGKHRKVHLFDIDIPGGIRFKESETLSAGNEFTIVEVDGHKVGIGICYDIRFEEMAKIYRNKGCELLIYPAAFNMTTGPMHWELLQRSRANDNQLFVASISPSRDETAGYVAFGHSMVVDPWAKILASAKEAEEIVLADLDFSLVQKVRQQIPIYSQRRTDLYSTESKS